MEKLRADFQLNPKNYNLISRFSSINNLLIEGDTGMLNFRNKAIKEIKIWAWFAAVAPLVGLSVLFFIWFFDFNNSYERALTIGFIIMFTTAIIWWWWAIHKIAQITEVMYGAMSNFNEVKKEIEQIRKDIVESGQLSD